MTWLGLLLALLIAGPAWAQTPTATPVCIAGKVADLGSVSGTSVSVLTLNIAGDIADHDLIMIALSEGYDNCTPTSSCAEIPPGLPTDSAGNGYFQLFYGSGGSASAQSVTGGGFEFAPNVHALHSGDVITVPVHSNSSAILHGYVLTNIRQNTSCSILLDDSAGSLTVNRFGDTAPEFGPWTNNHPSISQANDFVWVACGATDNVSSATVTLTSGTTLEGYDKIGDRAVISVSQQMQPLGVVIGGMFNGPVVSSACSGVAFLSGCARSDFCALGNPTATVTQTFAPGTPTHTVTETPTITPTATATPTVTVTATGLILIPTATPTMGPLGCCHCVLGMEVCAVQQEANCQPPTCDWHPGAVCVAVP